MVKLFIIISRIALRILQGHIFPDQSGLTAFAAGQQHQGNGTAFFVPQELQAFWLHAVFCGRSTKLCQLFRLVYQIKVAAEPEHTRRGGKERSRIAGIFPSGKGCFVLSFLVFLTPTTAYRETGARASDNSFIFILQNGAKWGMMRCNDVETV